MKKPPKFASCYRGATFAEESANQERRRRTAGIPIRLAPVREVTMLLSGKTAIVTGGAGALGSAVVKGLLEAGARVAAPIRKPGELERLRQSAGLDPKAPLSGEQLDLTDEAAVLREFSRVAKESGGLDILVNAAGGFAGGKPAHETAWSVWQQQLDLNLKTTVLSSRAAAIQMLESGGGAIVNVSSRPATEDGKDLAAYAAAKRGVLQLTEAMAAELRNAGVTVNAILPSIIDTPANRASMPEADFSRWPKPEEIARVILFLVGPDARLISGAHIPVYGRA
jgi:NAD(P)-dependent dehydrogenase (short-subunit alcohol dehydrogenase family)